MSWYNFLSKCGVYCFVTFTLMACSSGPKPETTAAITALKALNSKVTVGINIQDYATAVRDTKVAFDRAVEADSKSKDNVNLKEAMDSHLAALALWRCDFEDDTLATYKCRNNAYENTIFILNSKIKDSVESKKAFLDSSFYFYKVDDNKVIKFLWQSSESSLDFIKSK